jgi:transketolase
MELGRANLEEFGATLRELGAHDKNVLIVTSDSRGSGKLVPFANALPEQVVEVGIAEQTLVGVAAGLASAGKTVFAVSPASFLTARALEQIKNDVAYSDNPVNLIGISAGVSYGALGSTHHSLHDFAALRAIHNVSILAPADNFETRESLKAAASSEHPIYIRFGKRPMAHLHDENSAFEIGRAIPLSTGTDITFVATGETVIHAVEAREMLERQGYSCGVMSMHTVKPLDEDALLTAARNSRAIVTVEEHSVYGGLGGACAEALMQSGVHVAFQIVGIPDEYTITGSQADIFCHYGISAQGLSGSAKALIESMPTAPETDIWGKS